MRLRVSDHSSITNRFQHCNKILSFRCKIKMSKCQIFTGQKIETKTGAHIDHFMTPNSRQALLLCTSRNKQHLLVEDTYVKFFGWQEFSSCSTRRMTNAMHVRWKLNCTEERHQTCRMIMLVEKEKYEYKEVQKKKS